MENRYFGVNFNNLRKALHLLYFGTRNGDCNDFSTEKYKYIIPMQGSFENPLLEKENPAKDTFILYWIEQDKSLTQDDYVVDTATNIGYDRQKCVADILLRFTGREAEDWVKALRHLAKRNGVTDIWSGVCNAEKLEYTSPVIPRRVDYFGRTSQIAFDIRFKLYYDECISTGWKPLEGVDFTVTGELTLEE
jgi:hypothetical protein